MRTPPSSIPVATRTNCPTAFLTSRYQILILHGVADSPDEGGSAMTNVQMARDFEAAMRRAGKTVEAFYYEGSGHNGLFASPTQYRDEVERMTTFLRRTLRD